MRETSFRNDDERVRKLADTYKDMCERKRSVPESRKDYTYGTYATNKAKNVTQIKPN